MCQIAIVCAIVSTRGRGGEERCVCVYCGTMAWVWIVWFILYSSACYFRTRSGSASVCALIIWNGHKQKRPIDRKFESTPRVFAMGEEGEQEGVRLLGSASGYLSPSPSPPTAAPQGAYLAQLKLMRQSCWQSCRNKGQGHWGLMTAGRGVR